MSVRVDLAKNGKRIYLETSRPLAGMKATIPGANFNKGQYGKPYWSLPLSMPVCTRLREAFGPELEIGPALWAWAKSERFKAMKMKALSGARDAELARVPAVAPRLAKAMESRTYQRVGARFVAEATAHGAGCLIADQPGLGKTLEALGGIVESGVAGPYLVVTPKTSVVPVWGREIPRWLDGQEVVTLPEGDKTVNKVKATQRVRRDAVLDECSDGSNAWLVIHPEAIRTRAYWVCGVCGQETPRKAGKVELKCKDGKRPVFHDPELRKKDRIEHEYPQLFAREWGAIIVDESDRSLLRLTGTPTQTRLGMEMARLRTGGVRLAMTGTPTRGRPHLLWGQINWLDSKAYPSFWNWTELFWELSSNGYSQHVIGKLVREEELWASLDRYVLRRTKAEVAPDLPPKTYVGTPVIPGDEDSPYGVWLPMEGAQARAYKDMLETSAADLEDGSRVEAIGILAELMRLKQFAIAAGRMIPQVKWFDCDGEVCKEALPHKHQRTVQHFKPTLPSNKFEYLVQLLDELGFPDDPSTKVAVCSQFTEVLNLFAAELPARLQALSVHPRTPLQPGILPVLLTGEQTGRRREDAIAAMNEPLGSGAHLMLLQTKTGGVAITLDQVDVMVVIDETWVPDDQEQVEDRIHRVSRPRPVFYHYLRSLDSVDHGIALTNAERDESSKRILDGRRGVEYARAVLRRTQELSGGVVHSSGGVHSFRSDGLLDGSSGGTRKARTLDGNTNGRDGESAPGRRDRSEETSDKTLAPKQSGQVQRSQTKTTKESKTMAKTMSDAEILAYKDKDTTTVQARYADWLIEKLELEFSKPANEAAFREAVRLSTALRMIFQASPENQEARDAARSERAEAKPAKGKGKGKAAAEVEPDEDEADEEPTPKAKAKPGRPAKATKAAKPAVDEDEDDTAVSPPAKRSVAKKASARAGAAAPF